MLQSARRDLFRPTLAMERSERSMSGAMFMRSPIVLCMTRQRKSLSWKAAHSGRMAGWSADVSKGTSTVAQKVAGGAHHTAVLLSVSPRDACSAASVTASRLRLAAAPRKSKTLRTTARCVSLSTARWRLHSALPASL